ncbi:MAG: hypothetical protein C5B52_08305 [Bacteroidetes bacterium]|nr:MAG: hypothetical protein C5B52_08305 [Bacteroidota bacterium]
MEKVVIKGKLEPFWETGTEGVIWCATDETKEGYDSLCILHDGDHLTIYNDDRSEILWSGIIDLNWKTRFRQFPTNPNYGQQEVLGFWVHGLQEGLDPEQWGKWFFKYLPTDLIVGPLNSHLYPVENDIIVKYGFQGITGGIRDLVVKYDDGSFYCYKDVKNEDFWGFYNSESKSSYLKDNMTDKYEREKIEF